MWCEAPALQLIFVTLTALNIFIVNMSTDIFTACRFDDVSVLRNLLKSGAGGVSCNTRNQFGATPLHFCATYGSRQCAAELLAHGADFRCQESTSGWTPLHLALYYRERSLPVALQLIQAGASCYGPSDQEHLNPLELLSLCLFEKRSEDAKKPSSKPWYSSHSPLQVRSRMYHLQNPQNTARIVGRRLAPDVDVATAPLPMQFPSVLAKQRSVEVAPSAQPAFVSVDVNALDFVQIEIRTAHTLALTKCGSVWLWGSTDAKSSEYLAHLGYSRSKAGPAGVNLRSGVNALDHSCNSVFGLGVSSAGYATA